MLRPLRAGSTPWRFSARASLALVGLALVPGGTSAAQLTADPTDVASIDGIIQAYYEVVSGPAGVAPDIARDRSLHTDDAVVAIAGVDGEGRSTRFVGSLDDYYDRVGRGPRANGFFETEIHRRTDRFGSIANVWSTYAYRPSPGGPVTGRGINSIQLWHDGNRWWITGWSFDSERPDNPIPAAYLPSGEPAVSAGGAQLPAPRLHHTHVNTVDPEAALDLYLRIWPDGSRGEMAGHPAFLADVPILFTPVDEPPSGSWDRTLQRSEPQSPFWHLGGFVDTTDRFEALEADGLQVLRLETGPGQGPGVVRSGLAPYAGVHTADELAEVERADPRPGGFGYVVGPDGALVELTGSPTTEPAWAHVHLFHEQPRCAANWYVEVLGFQHAPTRDPATGDRVTRERWDPCGAQRGSRGFPSLERAGTVRSPAASVIHGTGSVSLYPRQGDVPLVSSRGQVLDHVAFAVDDLAAWEARLAHHDVVIVDRYPFGAGRALLLEGPDGFSIELVQIGESAP